MVSLGIRTDDPGSGSSVLANNRTISTYFHGIEKLGLAQQHILEIADKVAKATDVEAHELVVRLRASGGDAEELRQFLVHAKREMGNLEHASRYRIFQNSDKSIDAELRVTTDEDFRGTVLDLGEVTGWPKMI